MAAGTGKLTPVWSKAIRQSADPARTRHFYDLLVAAAPGRRVHQSSAEQARILACVFAGSQFLSVGLISHPEWLDLLTPEALLHPRRPQGLVTELNTEAQRDVDQGSFTTAFRKVREFKQREMLRIAARDLSGRAPLPETLIEISAVGDTILSFVWRACYRQLQERHGSPYHTDSKGNWRPTEACVLGMGKLGGQELNYSSDVDVLFVYSEEGGLYKVRPAGKAARPGMTSHQFFNRLSEAFITEVSKGVDAGQLFRIDLRLRPEGDSGPLSRSIASYENYYAQWGQTWERMMLIKARRVAGDQAVEAEFLETIQPFRYPRSINQNVLHEVAAMKDRIENEVVRSGELDRNVKLGRGGIREIEFIAQSQQLLHAGRQPFLQGAQTLPMLEKLAQYEHLETQECRVLTDAYIFLRQVEHRLQMEDNRQTHTLPSDTPSQLRVALGLGFKSVAAFLAELQTQMARVRSIFDKVLKAEQRPGKDQLPFPSQFEGAEQAWKQLLSAHGFRDENKAFNVLREFVEGPGYVHVSSRTIELARQLLPRLFALCPKVDETGAVILPSRDSASRPNERNAPLSDPDRVVTRLDSFIAAYGARSTLFELWNSNPSIFELLILLFDRSEFLAELAIRTPDLVDELVTSDRLRQRKTSEETLRDLLHGINDEDQHGWIRKYHQAELTRIGSRDILGLAEPDAYLTELSALADACLRYAVKVIMHRHRLKQPPFAVIGLGKLGGSEIDYGSDLDILFVADRNARNLVKVSQLAQETQDLISTRTEKGLVFHTDARLRPDGEKGLLVNTLAAYEDYYRQRAHLWELQALSRARSIAGPASLCSAIERLASELTDLSSPSLPLAAYTPDWKEKIHKMRMRIENERTPAGKGELAIKTGEGGLIDAEFMAQTLCLGRGWRVPNTLAALERGRSEGFLGDSDAFLTAYKHLRRVEGILRRWSYEGEVLLPEDPAPYRRVAIRCRYATAEEFRRAVANDREVIRSAYNQFFGK